MTNDNDKYSYSFYSPEGGSQRPPAPEKKKNRMAAKIVALCLSCTLIGGAMGGVAGWYVSGNSGQAPETTAAATEQTSAMPVATGTVTSAATSTLESIYDRCNPSVVAIATEGTQTNVFGQSATFASAGSGFIISADGYIVTNAHVISGSSKITVMLYDGTTASAKIVGQDSDADVAVLKVEKTGLTAISFGDSDNLKVGEQVIAIGNPLGELANTMTTGILSALDREINIDGTPMNMLQTDASISPGNSGGPLIDLNGNVIGVVSAKSSGSGVEGIGFAIPINDVRETVDQLLKYGYVKGRAKLGVSIDTSYSAAASYYNMPEGCYVNSVESGSSAAKAGVQKGDVITALGDKKVISYEELVSALSKCKAGDTSTITVNRNGTVKTFSITFDEKQPETEQSTTQPSQQGSSGDDLFRRYFGNESGNSSEG